MTLATGVVVLLATQAPAVGYDPVFDLLSKDVATRKRAETALLASKDKSLIPALSDVLYYHVVVRDTARAREISELMEKIAGESVGPNVRRGWAEWVGRHEEVKPLEGYLAFKAALFTRYDPAFRRFLDLRFTYRIRPEEIEWGGVNVDGIPALENPRHLRAADAKHMKPADRVFGVYLNGEARAYPHLIMDPHEMANDSVGGVPVSLSYCTLCGSGVLYDGRVSDRTFTFGSSGLLYRSNKLMYDRQTGSLWNNLTGEPVSGPLASSGIRLEMLPVVVTTWQDWLKLHPDTIVLDPKGTGFDRDYTESPYAAYFKSKDTMFPVWLQSKALGTKDVVFALIVNGKPKAYPVEALKRERITHDRLGGKDVVLITRSSGAVRAYEARGRRFKPGASSDELVEETSGTSWRLTEDCIQLDRERLPRLPGHTAFWFGWYAFYPSTEVYEPR